MDYEVFLLSRIKEEHDKGSDNVRSVALGLERTGRIVSAAAILISVVFVAFATSEVSFIKLFGVGLALAVLLDAFVIRGTLVPAFMRLAGEVNWWAPAPLRRLHARIGVSEIDPVFAAPPSEPDATPPTAPTPVVGRTATERTPVRPRQLVAASRDGNNGQHRTRQELYDEAKRRGIPGRSRMSRDELAAALDH
jgi:RND superfamily putative drug exporter